MFKFSTCSLPAVLARLLLVVLFLAVRLPVAAQVPAWQSARAIAAATVASASSYSLVSATAVDAVGNVYLTGYFTNTVVLGGITLTSFGDTDVFVAKFNPTNNQFVWAQRAGGMGGDFTSALTVSGASVYVTGTFNSPTAVFGTTTLTNASTNFVAYDVFVAKLTDTGSFTWAQQVGGTGDDYTYNNALAVSGNSVYVAGGFASPTASFGSINLTNAGNTGSVDVFVAKLTDTGSTGNFVWAQRAGGTDDDYCFALAVSSTNVYVAGQFGSPLVNFGATTLTSAGASDMFVTKLNDAGNASSFVWAQRSGGTRRDYASALAVRGTSVYITGSFGSSTMDFGPTTLTNADVTASSLDVFVTKLTDVGNTGSFAWAQRAGGIGNDNINALAVNGTVMYITGDFSSSTASFGTTTLANADATASSSDVFVAKLTDIVNTSSFAGAQRAGGAGFDSASGLAIGGTSVYIVGRFRSSTADFGTLSLFNPNTTNLGFLATLTDPTLTATTSSRTLTSAQLYPNPARHTATLRLPAGTAPAPITITDALGRTVRDFPAPTTSEATLDLRGLPAGLYLLRGAGPAQRLMVE
jgi:hypothetical protein